MAFVRKYLLLFLLLCVVLACVVLYYVLSFKTSDEAAFLIDPLEMEKETGGSIQVAGNVEDSMKEIRVKDESTMEREKWDRLKKEYARTIRTSASLDNLTLVPADTQEESRLWYGYILDDVNLYFTDSALQKYVYLVDAANVITKDIESYMGKTFQQKVDVYVADLYEDYTKMYEGYHVQKHNYIVLNVHDIPDYDIRPLFAHELTHALQRELWSIEALDKAFGIKGENWLLEGLAEYVTTQKVNYPPFHNYVGNILGHNLTYEQYKDRLEDFYYLEEDQAVAKMKGWPKKWYKDEYAVYETIIYYLETQYGFDALMKWLQSISDGMSLATATKQAFAKTESQLIADWKAHFRLQ